MEDYQSRSNLVKDENGDLLADSHNILNRWKYFSQLFNVHRGNDVRQIEIYRAEQLIPEHSRPFEVETAIVKQKTHESPGND
jgi:hypothetical protein